MQEHNRPVKHDTKVKRNFKLIFEQEFEGNCFAFDSAEHVAEKICCRVLKVEENAHRWVFLGNSGTGNSKEVILPCRSWLRRSGPVEMSSNGLMMKESAHRWILLGQFWNENFERSLIALFPAVAPPVEMLNRGMS